MAETQTTTTEEAQAATGAKTGQAKTDAQPKNNKAEAAAYWTAGRRKSAVARVQLALGKGNIVVNGKPLEDMGLTDIQKAKILATLAVTERQASFDISIKVAGGGAVAQLDAMALGIARALLAYDTALRPQLRQAKLLTRDARVKERKKYGLKRARKAPQFSKR